MIPILDLSRTHAPIADDLKRALVATVDSGQFLKGPATRAFEQAWAEYCGAAHCLSVANGTDAIELVLRALGAAGGEVITAANAGGYTTTAARLAGAVPVHADIDPRTHCISPAAALALVGPRTRVVVATHLYGNLADVAAIRAGLAAMGRGDVRVVEDCAQAHALRAADGPVGSLADAATFSFYPSKNLGALGDAGAITCRDESLHRELLALHQYGWTRRYAAERPGGRNSRMDELQAAVLLVKLPHLADWTAQRQAIVQAYADAAPPRLRPVTGQGPTVAHLAVLQVPERDALRARMTAAGVATDVHYPTLDPDQPAQAGLAQRDDGLADSRQAVGEIVTLPCFPGMTRDEVARVAEVLAA